MDRLVHMLASGILANAYLRWMYVGYMILLHLMVFFMLLDAGHRYVITASRSEDDDDDDNEAFGQVARRW